MLWCAGFSKIARLTRSANCKVEEVSFMDAMEGETQMISRILPEPIKDSLRIRVSLESRTGMCVLDWMVKEEMQCPSLERLPLMDLSSSNLISF